MVPQRPKQRGKTLEFNSLAPNIYIFLFFLNVRLQNYNVTVINGSQETQGNSV